MRQICSFFVLLILLLPALAFAQEPSSPPDYTAIQAAIGRAGTPLYYPALLDRYKGGDTTLTWQEKRHLYYGASFQPGFSVYAGSTRFDDSLRTILKQHQLQPGDTARLVRFADSILAEDPWNLDALQYQAYGYKLLGNTPAQRRNVEKIYILLEGALSSGNGKDQEEAIHVNRVADEYAILQLLDLEFGGEQKLLNGHYDWLKLAPNQMGWGGIWFDVARSLALSQQLFDFSPEPPAGKKGKKR